MSREIGRAPTTTAFDYVASGDRPEKLIRIVFYASWKVEDNAECARMVRYYSNAEEAEQVIEDLKRNPFRKVVSIDEYDLRPVSNASSS